MRAPDHSDDAHAHAFAAYQAHGEDTALIGAANDAVRKASASAGRLAQQQQQQQHEHEQQHSSAATRAVLLVRRRRRVVAVVAVLLALLVLAFVLMVVIAAFVPTDLWALRDQVAPWHRAAQLEPLGMRCAWTQAADASTCANVSAVPHEIAVRFASRLTQKGLAQLRGVLTLPGNGSSATARAGVVLMGGSGPTRADSPAGGELVASLDGTVYIMRDIAHALAARGIASLRFDKRSCGACYAPDGWTFDPATFRFSDFVDDAADAARFLAAYNASLVRPDSIGLLGHSQGAQFVPFVAANLASNGTRYSGAALSPVPALRIAAATLVAGPLGTFVDTYVAQLERITAIRLAQADIAHAIDFRIEAARVAACGADIASGAYDPASMCLGGGVTQAALAAYDLMLNDTSALVAAMGAPPSAPAATTDPPRVPMALVQGTLDRNINPPDLAAYAALAPRAAASMLRDVGHTLVDLISDGDSASPHVAASVLDAIADLYARVPLGE